MSMTRLFIISLWLFAATADAESLAVPGGSFDIKWRSDFSSSEKLKLRAWLEHSAQSVALINGSFPRKRTTILIQRASRGKGPVPWGNTIRHTQPEGVSFHVNPSANLEEFLADWTATHEFSHLLLPYPGKPDIWISEGFASYYQYILMMRNGTLSQQAGWQKIADGFARGAADTNQLVRLDVASREMRQRRAYKRVYWSGAHFFLEADIALRTLGHSLDQVIATFLICCRDRQIEWDGPQLVAALDEAANQSLFSPLFLSYQQSTELPDYHRSLALLGITVTDGQVSVSDNPELTARRNAVSADRN